MRTGEVLPVDSAGRPCRSTLPVAAQYQPTDSEWAQAEHGVPYRPEM